MKHVGWVKRAKLSTTAPPPIARNPSPADGMTLQWLKANALSTPRLQNPWVLAAALQNSTVA
jgi:hypothetical protein